MGMAVNAIWAIKITVNIRSCDIQSATIIHYLKVKIILETSHLLNREYGAVV
jgi:hypothetical protein